jgi:predicted RNase H-like HicB family nuclease
MREFTVIFERGTGNHAPWGACVPDLPGCTSLGETREEIERNIREAIEGHIQSMIEQGEPVPEPTTEAARVPVLMGVAA